MKLVFVHGAGESSLSFYYQQRHFRRSKAIDLPGHPDGAPCYDIEGYVEWLRGFIAARRYSDIVLCGHSMGGAITMQYALTYPQELKGIILVGSGARLRVYPDYFESCRQPGQNNSEWLEARRKSYEGVRQDLIPVLMRRAAEIGPAVDLNDLQACDRFDVMERIADIQLPAQTICGSEDIMTPVKYSTYMAEKIPGAQELVVDGGSHYVQLEKHQQVNRQIEEFMKTLS